MNNSKSFNMLAVVIPYYKIGHFKELLSSLVNQTNQNFNIYIGDDDSPESPQEIISYYKDKLNITYKRFQENLGGKNLTKQWDRCVGMIGNEGWVWVLPDDDLPAENCVEEFYKALPDATRSSVKVFRLPLKIIDGNGNVIEDLQHKEPLIENNIDYYMRMVKGETSSSLGDNIFHRESFEKSGGFVDFPKAWGSDHATVLNVSSGGNLYCLKHAVLFFRMSGENISSNVADGLEKLQSRVLFAKWLKNHEEIFPRKPDDDFYKFFYWKGEYYVLRQWKVSVPLLKALYELRKVCFDSSNVLPIFKIALRKTGLFRK